ncbi:hypothetical protein ACFFHJ_20870 [Planotetraspora thailandica]|nr:hypothetical protein [Planotetraspora thailandica]
MSTQLVPFGRLADKVGCKRMFTPAGLLCAVAPGVAAVPGCTSPRSR